ncbi:fimbrial protein [Escherichia marmotae]|uniref:fimbrial protein n=1 Tax=Escherichia marmotae TaxID=1499973 RepID=UPI002F336E74|nr:fimbrial protein [Escherichia coli]
MKKKMTGIMLLAALFMSASTQASDNLQFKGKLIIPNCTVNNGNPIETDFGDIEIQTIAAKNTGYHWKSLNIPVDCSYTLGTPKIKLTGNKASVYNNAIKTTKYDAEKLVIYFRQGTADNRGAMINLGSYQNLATDAIIGSGGTKRTVRITAGVGREQGMELLTPGPFTASANMEVRYE